FYCSRSRHHRTLIPFPTRRSSDLVGRDGKIKTLIGPNAVTAPLNGPKDLCVDRDGTIVIADAENNLVRRFDPKASTLSTIVGTGDRKSTRLNSSHQIISYAVFCLK